MKKKLNPAETLLVVDAMTGQDAVRSAEEFNSRVSLTGLVLTKMDGDARGGAALSIRWVSGVPIKFIGIGEKADALEPFYPDRLASRILGMGDVLSLIEKVEKSIVAIFFAFLAIATKLINFEQAVVQSDRPVLVDFWAPWCGPCKMIAPVLEEIAQEYEGKAKVVKINIDDNQNTPAQFGVRSIPTLILFKNGQEVEKIIGAQGKDKLTALIDSAL